MKVLKLEIKIPDKLAKEILKTNKIVYEDGAIKLGKHEVKIGDIISGKIITKKEKK